MTKINETKNSMEDVFGPKIETQKQVTDDQLIKQFIENNSIRRVKKNKEEIELYTVLEDKSNVKLIAQHGSTSGAIRHLASQGYKAGQIAKMLNIRPQHAYNVMNQIIKRK